MLDGLQFLWWFMAAVGLLPIFMYFLPPLKRHDGAINVPFYHIIGGESSQNPIKKQKLFYGVLWMLLVLAAMRPQWVGESVGVPLSGRDFMIAVDLSASMGESDFLVGNKQITRLHAVKNVMGDFIDEREGDRLGLIFFGETAHVQSPLTYDTKIIHHYLDEAVLGIAGRATAIGDAIGLGVKRLRALPQEQRVMVLVTDGANTAGVVGPIGAAQFAAQEGIKIYTIGMGADSMLKRTMFGVQRVNPSLDLDEETLQAIADTTGGKYYRAHDTDELKAIYEALNEQEPIAQDSESLRPRLELYPWVLAVIFILLAIRFLSSTFIGRVS